MVVFKFGGASVRDAWGIKNLATIVGSYNEELIIVISAFGKTTNALERVLTMWMAGDDGYKELLGESVKYHMDVIVGLGMSQSDTAFAFNDAVNELAGYLSGAAGKNYDLEYDQVVSYGEIWSTLIVSGYLNSAGVNNKWIDIRKILVTTDKHRDAGIIWEESLRRVGEAFRPGESARFVTQGFIGATTGGVTTTLGREGSDYTAALLANMLDATRVVVWKDVPGLLNADPKWMSDAERLPVVSYQEAVEMTFSGAKVIHPKTIKPLHNKSIPLYVKSFLEPEAEGTIIVSDAGGSPLVPVFVRKEDQIMISILPRDFSFAISENLSNIFQILTVAGIKVNLVQASAVSINICADYERDRIKGLLEEMGDEFRIVYNEDVEIITIRHYTQAAIDKMIAGRQVMIEQRTRRTVRFVLK
ncbi:MAG: aspartate kinase [Bacteroidales bacterium]|nr:aspartate kinase [Bacteroidales bacterium]